MKPQNLPDSKLIQSSPELIYLVQELISGIQKNAQYRSGVRDRYSERTTTFGELTYSGNIGFGKNSWLIFALAVATLPSSLMSCLQTARRRALASVQKDCSCLHEYSAGGYFNVCEHGHRGPYRCLGSRFRKALRIVFKRNSLPMGKQHGAAKHEIVTCDFRFHHQQRQIFF